MKQNVTIESLLVLGIGAIATGIERLEVDILLGVVLTLIGTGLIGLRYFLKSKE